MLLGLAACQARGGPQTDAAAPAAPPVDAPAAAEVSAAPARDSDPSEPAPAGLPEAAGWPEAAQQAALPPEPAIDDDPERLIGLDRGALDALLGRPALVRREPPAEIWQYHGATCVFDVFLYEEAGGHRVSYLEARDSAARRVAARECLNELLRARLGLPLG